MSSEERERLVERCRSLRDAGYSWTEISSMIGLSRYAARRAAVGPKAYHGPVIQPSDPDRERRIRVYMRRAELGLPLFPRRRS